METNDSVGFHHFRRRSECPGLRVAVRLPGVQSRVGALTRQQRGVVSFLDHTTPIYYQDAVRCADRREPVRDDQADPALEHGFDSLLDPPLEHESRLFSVP